jgi:hypothetical protein
LSVRLRSVYTPFTGPERQPVRLVGLAPGDALPCVVVPGVVVCVAVVCAAPAIVSDNTSAVARNAFFIAFLLIKNMFAMDTSARVV